jgi:hypothetical protein
MDSATRAAWIRHYIETGEGDADLRGWPGANIVEQAQTQHAALSGALIAEIRRREPLLLIY